MTAVDLRTGGPRWTTWLMLGMAAVALWALATGAWWLLVLVAGAAVALFVLGPMAFGWGERVDRTGHQYVISPGGAIEPEGRSHAL